jgi:hypothetical protein
LISSKKSTPNQGKRTHPHLKAAASISSPATATAPATPCAHGDPLPIDFLAEDFVISIPRQKKRILLGFPVRAGSPKARSRAWEQWRSISASTGGWPSCTAPTPRSTGRMKSRMKERKCWMKSQERMKSRGRQRFSERPRWPNLVSENSGLTRRLFWPPIWRDCWRRGLAKSTHLARLLEMP